jgi:hypothetical protein
MARVDTIAREAVNILSGAVAAQVTAKGPLQLQSYTVATAPSAAGRTGSVIFVTNGNSGAPCIAVSNGTNWLRIALGTAIAAS